MAAAVVETQPLSVPTELSQLSGVIDQKIQSLASGDEDFQKSALTATKYLFDLGKTSQFTLLYHIYSYSLIHTSYSKGE